NRWLILAEVQEGQIGLCSVPWSASHFSFARQTWLRSFQPKIPWPKPEQASLRSEIRVSNCAFFAASSPMVILLGLTGPLVPTLAINKYISRDKRNMLVIATNQIICDYVPGDVDVAMIVLNVNIATHFVVAHVRVLINVPDVHRTGDIVASHGRISRAAE